jgi:hypothetical protein
VDEDAGGSGNWAEGEDFRAALRDFSARECGTREQRQRWLDPGEDTQSSELLAWLTELGWLGVAIPERYGGSGGTQCRADAAVRGALPRAGAGRGNVAEHDRRAATSAVEVANLDAQRELSVLAHALSSFAHWRSRTLRSPTATDRPDRGLLVASWAVIGSDGSLRRYYDGVVRDGVLAVSADSHAR